MLIGFRTRCYPRPVLANALAQWLGCQRAVGNAKAGELELNLWLRKRAILSPSWDGPDPVRPLVPQLRFDRPGRARAAA